MDAESSLSEESMKQKKPHRSNRRIDSDESSSNDSFMSARSQAVEFDALKTDTPSKENADVSNDDPLLLPSNNNENEASTTEKADEDVNKVFQIKLVPIANLMEKKPPPIEVSSDASTETSDDEPLSRKLTSGKKHFSKHRSTRRLSQLENSDLDDELDSDVTKRQPVTKPRHKAKDKSTIKLPNNVFSAKIKLSRLPSNMEPLLKKYNLSAICDANNVVVSRKSTQRNEVYLYVLFAKRTETVIVPLQRWNGATVPNKAHHCRINIYD